jgi:glycosyltransferase involved in cell wall biosynthesis
MRNDKAGTALTNKPHTHLTVILPLYNEGGHLEASFRVIQEVLDTLPVHTECLLIDDGSTDDTWETITRIVAGNTACKGLRLSRNFGKEGAIAAGLDRAQGDGVLVMDGDLQHPPSLIPEMLAPWQSGEADVVEAIKLARGEEPRYRRIAGQAFNRAWSGFTGFEMEGATDFKLLDRKVVEAWRAVGENQLFYRGMVAWLGFRRRTITFEVPPGARPASVWGPLRLVRFALMAITSFTTAPLHFVTLMGLLTLAASAVMLLYTLFYWLTGQAATGFTTVIALQLFSTSLLMISLGIIGEYLGRNYLETKRRPRYVVSETTMPINGVQS